MNNSADHNGSSNITTNRVSLSLDDGKSVCRYGDAVCVTPAQSSESVAAVAVSALTGDVWDGMIVLVQCSTGRVLSRTATEAGNASITWCGSRSSVLAVGSDDGDVHMFAHSGGGALKRQSTLQCHDDVVSAVCAHSDDTNQILASSWDRSVSAWQLGEEQPHARLRTSSEALCAAWQHGSRHTIAAGTKGSCMLIGDTRQPEWANSFKASQYGDIQCVATKASAVNQFLFGTRTGDIILMDQRRFDQPMLTIKAHKGAVTDMHWHPQESTVFASSSDDKSVAVHDVSSSSVRSGIIGDQHQEYARGVRWCPLDKDALLLSAGWDDSLIIRRSTAKDLKAIFERPALESHAGSAADAAGIADADAMADT